MRCFHMFLSDSGDILLPADLRKPAYIVVMRKAYQHKWISIFTKSVRRSRFSVQEKAQVLRAVAATPDPDLVLEVLSFFLTDELRAPDIIYGLAGISIEGRETSWHWLRANWDLILKKWGDGMLLNQFPKNIVTLFCSNDKADELEAFLASHGHPSMGL